MIHTISESFLFILFIFFFLYIPAYSIFHLLNLKVKNPLSKFSLIPSFSDSMWSISIVNELARSFPPDHPGFAGVALSNYHYFYHLFLAGILAITHINVIHLYYYIAPIFVSLLFGLGLYALISLFMQNKVFCAFGILLNIASLRDMEKYYMATHSIKGIKDFFNNGKSLDFIKSNNIRFIYEKIADINERTFPYSIYFHKIY